MLEPAAMSMTVWLVLKRANANLYEWKATHSYHELT
jgi:hypothetical protein